MFRFMSPYDRSTPLVDAPPLAASGDEYIVDAQTPLCLVCDEDSSVRHFLSLVLQSAGVDVEEYASGAELRQVIGGKQADLVLIDIPLDISQPLETLGALGRIGFRGAVQLMSHRGTAVLDHARAIGEHNQLRMLPALKKPFDGATIRAIVQELKIGLPPSIAARIGLGDALENRWVEFWLQPKIDLRRKQLAGAEVVARVRHPQYGILQPEAFLPGATAAELTRLAELGIMTAIQAERRSSSIGVNLRMSLDVDIATLRSLQVTDLVRDLRPDLDNWPGLIIDIPEAQIASDIPLAIALDSAFAPFKVKLAIDDAGRSRSVLAKAATLPFAEFKIDETFVLDCSIDRINGPVCRDIIELAGRHGAAAVGNGITKAADLFGLQGMGCSYGQGTLLGAPMPEERFLSLLRQRAASQRAKAAAL